MEVIHKPLDRNLLWSVVALLGVAGGGYVYPPLDGDPIYWLALGVFLLPVGTAIVVAIWMRRRAQAPSPFWSGLFKLSAVFLTGMALVVFLNGHLDRSSVTNIHTKVVGKFIARGRFSMSYHLNVASWRRDGRVEDLRVSRHIYDSADNRDDISVQLHPGWFGLSWYGQIALSRRAVPARTSMTLSCRPWFPETWTGIDPRSPRVTAVWRPGARWRLTPPHACQF